MIDRFGREIDYVRISVTQACNLKCIYCYTENATYLGNNANRFLSAVEIGKVIEVMAGLGIRKVRITGGEPLTRPDLLEIISRIARIPGIDDIAMTTNGIGLATKIKALKEAGLMRVNISIDSLDNRKYAEITGGGDLNQVWNGLEAVLSEGLTPVKINVVMMKGINDNEIGQFIALTKTKPIEVRFIELMPIGKFGEENAHRILPNSAVVEAYPNLKPLQSAAGSVLESKIAQYYHIEGYQGRIGLISPMSHKFCLQCNRIRLTSDGKLKPCLGDNNEIDIGNILRNEPEKLEWFIQKAIFQKQAEHHFEDEYVSRRTMAAIGG